MPPYSRHYPIGLMLGRLLSHARREAMNGHVDDGIRLQHTHVLGNLSSGGTRLTDLATRAGMTLGAMSELVNELEELDYVERRPDPADGRAKLICLTTKGAALMHSVVEQAGALELDWARRVGTRRYNQMCRTMEDLLESLLSEDTEASNGREARRTG